MKTKKYKKKYTQYVGMENARVNGSFINRLHEDVHRTSQNVVNVPFNGKGGPYHPGPKCQFTPFWWMGHFKEITI
jgi:hypothetical protein